MYSRSQSSHRTHSLLMIFGPWIAPHSQVFSQILHVLHSDHRLILKTVRLDRMPSVAPTGHRNRQYAFLTNTVARSSVPSPDQRIHVSSVLVPDAVRANIQNGST